MRIRGEQRHQPVQQEIRKKFWMGSDALIPKASVTLVFMRVFNLQASTGNTIVMQKAGRGNSLIERESLCSHVFNESARRYPPRFAVCEYTRSCGG